MYQDDIDMDEDMVMYPDEWDMSEQERFERSMQTAGLLLDHEDISLEVCRGCRWGATIAADTTGMGMTASSPVRSRSRVTALTSRGAASSGIPPARAGGT